MDTRDDHTSHFPLYVDTVSYPLAREYVTDGQWPPKDAVRVEEFVNYFAQGYDSPPKAYFGIAIDAAPYPFAEAEGHLLMRVGIQSGVAPEDERRSMVLTFIVDVSGSTHDRGQLELLKNALGELVAELRPDDTVGIVACTKNARVMLEHTSARNKERILAAIGKLQIQTISDAQAGLVLGYQQADKAFEAWSTNHVILCSNRAASVGETGPASSLTRINEYASKGIFTTVVGVAMGKHSDWPERVASYGEGTYVYIDTPEEAHRVLVENLANTLHVISDGGYAYVDFNPQAVLRQRLLGVEGDIGDERFRGHRIRDLIIAGGHSVTALYEMQLRRGVSAEATLATVYLTWPEPGERWKSVMTESYSRSQVAAAFTEAAPRLQWDAIVAEYAEVLRGSPYAQQSSLAAVLQEAERVAKLLPDDPDVQEFVDLVRRADALPRPARVQP